MSGDLKKTPLHALHASLGAKFVPFAGYDMPVQYSLGVMGEHLHTRSKAGLFDVSHMGQVLVSGRDHGHVAAALEALVPGDVQALAPGQMLYSMLLSDNGGILDDLIITRLHADGTFGVVVNASRKEADLSHMRNALPDDILLDVISDRALLALQGPRAANVLSEFGVGPATLMFMTADTFDLDGLSCGVSRSGYTGEDGFEISVPADKAAAFASALLAHEDVEAIGLGARDSLRLEAGLCLHGQDIDETITPVEAGLSWTIGKRRRSDGGFPGAERILRELKDGPSRRRVGLLPHGRAPARQGSEVVTEDGSPIGQVTSGGFGPTLEAPCSMALVDRAYVRSGTEVGISIRGRINQGIVAKLPFVPHQYHRQEKR